MPFRAGPRHSSITALHAMPPRREREGRDEPADGTQRAAWYGWPGTVARQARACLAATPCCPRPRAPLCHRSRLHVRHDCIAAPPPRAPHKALRLYLAALRAPASASPTRHLRAQAPHAPLPAKPWPPTMPWPGEAVGEKGEAGVVGEKGKKQGEAMGDRRWGRRGSPGAVGEKVESWRHWGGQAAGGEGGGVGGRWRSGLLGEARGEGGGGRVTEGEGGGAEDASGERRRCQGWGRH